MPVYAFKCLSPEHKDEESRVFEKFIRFKENEKVRVDQSTCPECGFPAPRSFSNEGFSTPGITPIYANHHDDVKGSINNEIGFAFGKNKINPDGTIDKNAAAFSNTGELEKYLNGKNELGPPITEDNGKLARKPDGTYRKSGEKLFKYGPNDTPSRFAPRQSSGSGRGASWVGDTAAANYGNAANIQAPRARTRSR